jgi:hypothetical protein
MAGKVLYTKEMRQWLRQLGPGDKERIGAALGALERLGPGALPPQLSKRIQSSRHHNMRELRSVGGNLRVLFAFDRNRDAVMLAGGDKTNNWRAWYRENVPKADRLYDKHLRDDGRGGGGSWRSPRDGGRSPGR